MQGQLTFVVFDIDLSYRLRYKYAPPEEGRQPLQIFSRAQVKMAEKTKKAKLPTTPWGHLPPRMRVLFITDSQRTGGWLAEAFAADSATDVQLDEAIGESSGLARLRDESFDAVLISHEPAALDALKLLDAIRAGTSPQQPILVLGSQSEQEMAALCFEAGADAYISVAAATTRTLIWQVARAAERHRLILENRRLSQVHRHRLQSEHDEATRLLAQQRTLVESAEKIQQDSQEDNQETSSDEKPVDTDSMIQLPDALTEHYRELLRAYVIMGSGRLAEEMNQLSELLVSAGVTAQQAMHLHLRVLEDMVRDLGSRSARHVMNRADLLVLEVMINLAEGYRQRSLEGGDRRPQALSVGLDLESSAA